MENHIDVHPVLHRFGVRDGYDVDADGDGIRILETDGFKVGHTRPLARQAPAERLPPEPAKRRVIPSLEIHLNESQSHAADHMRGWIAKTGE